MHGPAPPIPAQLALIQAAVAPADAERLADAFRFATAAHEGQTRDEGTPFIEHPVRVAAILWSELGLRDVDVIVAALNHDVIEDSDLVDDALVASAFGERVAGMVVGVTKERVTGIDKEVRDRAYLDSLPDLPLESRMLKLADRIDNLRSVLNSGDSDKARRYLDESRVEFVPLALSTDQVAARLITDACDEIERRLAGGE